MMHKNTITISDTFSSDSEYTIELMKTRVSQAKREKQINYMHQSLGQGPETQLYTLAEKDNVWSKDSCLRNIGIAETTISDTTI